MTAQYPTTSGPSCRPIGRLTTEKEEGAKEVLKGIELGYEPNPNLLAGTKPESYGLSLDQEGKFTLSVLFRMKIRTVFKEEKEYFDRVPEKEVELEKIEGDKYVFKPLKENEGEQAKEDAETVAPKTRGETEDEL